MPELVRFQKVEAGEAAWAADLLQLAARPRNILGANQRVAASAFSIDSSARALLRLYSEGTSFLINFVSNLPKNLRSGGFSAMNAAAFSAISRFEASHYVGPINPPVILWQKALSKLCAWLAHRVLFFLLPAQAGGDC